MALPGPDAADQQWPPPEYNAVLGRQRQWSAWLSGDPGQLSSAYYNLGGNSQTGRSFFRTSGEAGMPGNRPGQYGAGHIGPVQRTFWGTRVSPGEKRSKLHVALAGDISAMSASLLYAKRPRFDLPDGETDTATAQWLKDLFDDDMHATLLEGAEIGSALGGVFLRANYDTSLTERAWLDIVHPDAAIPRFDRGVLTAVTFWRVIHDDGADVVRHLEQHDLRANLIHHGVYEGTQTNLGTYAPLSAYEVTAPLEQLTTGGTIALPDLPRDACTVVYIPNARPNRIWRDLAAATYLGRSDYSGAEGLMDSIDETMSMWMREVRLAKARLIVPPSYLDSLGPGNGAVLDLDREVYMALNMLGGIDGSPQITANQFAIRWREHLETLNNLISQTVTRCGFSEQTFGEQGTTAMTATEVEDRNRRTLLTRSKKLNYQRPRLRDITYTLMCLDKQFYGRADITPVRPDVTFPDAILPSPSELAQTAVALSTARAASMETLVAMVHPDWTPDQVAEEVEKIRDEMNFEVLGRARLTLTSPSELGENVGQQLDDVVDAPNQPAPAPPAAPAGAAAKPSKPKP